MDAATIRRLITEDIAREEEAINRHRQIVEVMARHEGKKITKRMDKDLARIGMRLSDRYGMTYVVAASGTAWKTDFSHQISYDTDPFYRREKFEGYDLCQGKAAESRNVERRAWLATSEPEQLAAKLKGVLQAIDDYATAPFGPAAHAVHEVVKKTLEKKFLWRVS